MEQRDKLNIGGVSSKTGGGGGPSLYIQVAFLILPFPPALKQKEPSLIYDAKMILKCSGSLNTLCEVIEVGSNHGAKSSKLEVSTENENLLNRASGGEARNQSSTWPLDHSTT